MKKFLSLLIVILFSLTLFACELGTGSENPIDSYQIETTQNIAYDGQAHTISYPTLPSGYTVEIIGDAKTEKGTYTFIVLVKDSSNKVAKTFQVSLTIGEGGTNPIVIPAGSKTVAEIISLMANYTNGQVSDETYTVHGKVTSSSYNSTYGSYTLYLEAPEGYTFQLYSAQLASSITNTYTATDALKGAEVVATGYLKLFSNASMTVYEISYIKDKSGDAYQSPIISQISGGTPDQKADPVDPTPTDKAYTPVSSVSVGTEYKYVVEHKENKKVYFIEGSMEKTYYYKTTTAYDSAAIITLETATGGYYVKIGSLYANVTSDSSHDTVYMEATAKTVWTFDATTHTMICSMNSKTLTLGCRSTETYETIRAVEFGKGHYEGYLTLATGGTTPVTPVDPVDPVDPPTSDFAIVESVSVGTEYKLFMVHGGTSKTLFVEGTMDTYYLKSTENFDDAAIIKLEAVEGGYSLKCNSNYINITKGIGSDQKEHINVTLDSSATSVWTFDATSKLIQTTVDSVNYTLGTRTDKSYDTFSAQEASSTSSYFAYLTLATGDDPTIIVDPTFDRTGIEFADTTVVHDGEEHSILLTGLSSDYTVTYTGNGQTEIGVYEVVATVKDAEEEVVAIFKAILTISDGTAAHFDGPYVS